MSYDLELYVEREATRGELSVLVEQLKGLAVEDDEPDTLTVVLGAKRTYCFTIDGPFHIDAEDVPEEVTAVVLDPSHLYTVVVEGSAEASIPYAKRFARSVVTELGGALLDQQSDGVWSRGSSRATARPVREERVETVDLHWYAPHSNVGSEFAARYLELCRKYLPEALPRRFGSFEPLQGKLAVNGDAAFIDGLASEDMLYFVTGSMPCLGGSLPGGADAHPRPVWSMSLSFLAEPLNDSRWRDALRRLFTAIADDLGAFYASAEVVGGAIWTGRSLAYDGQSQRPANPVTTDGWAGLPPYPVWWAYYGAPYRDVAPDEFVLINEDTDRGTFHSRSELPLAREALLAPLRAGLLRRRTGAWIDQDLVSSFAPNERNYMSPPLTRAARIPKELTSPSS